MTKLIALLYFVLSLYGCNVGGSAYVHHSRVDGAQALYSKAYAQSGVARFECLASATGQCHYTVVVRDCTPAVGARASACQFKPRERFALATGDSRQIPGLPDFVLCVSADAAAARPECEAPKAIVAR